MAEGLARAKVYRNVDLRQQWLGLEPFDALGLGALLWLLMLVNRHGAFWNLVLLCTAYAGLRLAKRGKPEGFTSALIRHFVLRRPFFCAAARDTQSAAFQPPSGSPDGASLTRSPRGSQGAMP